MTLRCSLSVAMARLLVRAAFVAALAAITARQHGHDIRALQAYLGHRNIQHTVRYTQLSPEHVFGISGENESKKCRELSDYFRASRTT